MVYVGFHKSLASTYVFTKEGRRSIYIAFKNNLAREGTYVLHQQVNSKVREMQETNEDLITIKVNVGEKEF